MLIRIAFWLIYLLINRHTDPLFHLGTQFGLVPSTSMVASNLMDIGLLCSREPALEAEAEEAAEGGASRPPTVAAILKVSH